MAPCCSCLRGSGLPYMYFHCTTAPTIDAKLTRKQVRITENLDLNTYCVEAALQIRLPRGLLGSWFSSLPPLRPTEQAFTGIAAFVLLVLYSMDSTVLYNADVIFPGGCPPSLWGLLCFQRPAGLPCQGGSWPLACAFLKPLPILSGLRGIRPFRVSLSTLLTEPLGKHGGALTWLALQHPWKVLYLYITQARLLYSTGTKDIRHAC